MPRRALSIATAISLAVLLGLFTTPILAKFGNTTDVPVGRLLTNVGKYVKDHPNDAAAHYTLGRIHSQVFTTKDWSIDVFRPKKPTDLPQFVTEIPTITDKTYLKMYAPKVTVAERTKHLQESLKEYRRATELTPNEGLYFLGLAWVLEQGADFIEKFNPSGIGKDDRPDIWRKEALAHYRKAYQLTLNSTLRLKMVWLGSKDAIASEAGKGLLQLAVRVPQNGISPLELKEVRLNLKKMDKIPGHITPVLFPLDGKSALAELVEPGRTVKFDLEATGRADRWPWVNAKAGILVWDSNRTGKITSGQQLFGSRTWQMFWKNGYEPLAALDNNGDGWLTGTELIGIAVWRDINGNGRSERGEVVPVEKMGIAGICVRPSGLSEGVPFQSEGIRMRSGETLPTYDWTPVSVRRN